jgi:hypothetical protein
MDMNDANAFALIAQKTAEVARLTQEAARLSDEAAFDANVGICVAVLSLALLLFRWRLSNRPEER